MLAPLTREKFEQIIPKIATGPQYAHYWGKFKDSIRRLLISLISIIAILLLDSLFGGAGGAFTLIAGSIGGLYWLWGPVYWASLRNASYRRFRYSGFWRGRVLDVFVTEELIGEEQTVNKRGELVVIENRERRINLEVGDESGFRAKVQAPLSRTYKGIVPGQIAELLVLSDRPDLERIAKITDVYLPDRGLWIGEYPYLRRDVFQDVSNELGSRQPSYSSSSRNRYFKRSRS